MIINCECGKKKFNVDSSLIPEEGRLLKCGSCSKIWHYIPVIKPAETEDNSMDHIKEEIINDDVNDDSRIKIKDEKSTKNIKEETINNEKKNSQDKNSKENNNNLKKIFYYFIVFVITLFGIIFLIDTMKVQITNIFPGITPMIESFYQTLLDFKLFFKDLTN